MHWKRLKWGCVSVKKRKHIKIWHSEELPSWYIVIMKANEMHNFSNLFDKILYMFRTCPLSIIRSISTMYTHNSYLSFQFCWCLSASSLPRQQTQTELGRQIPIACIQCWDTPDDGEWTCSKHVEYFIK